MLAIAIASAKQIPLGAELVHHANTGNQAITPELSSYLQGLLDVSDVPGLSVGVVRLSGKGEVETEYGSWGNMTEDGDKVTHEVRFYRPRTILLTHALILSRLSSTLVPAQKLSYLQP